MKFLRIFSRLLIGAIFVFSGYTKAIDPAGSAIIFTEYFHAFGWNFFIPLAPFFGVSLSTAELVLGICLLTGLRMNLTAWGTLLFMSFFTILTFILAITNIVQDCGCFGEAIKLSNWETFFKNIFIFPFVGVVFWQRRNYKDLSCCLLELISVGVFTLMVFGLTWYCHRHLPLIDFMAYKVGTNIPEAMAMPAGATPDEYETVLYYEKDRKKQKFTVENFPQDSTWKFIEAVSVLKKKGYTPPARDFSIYSTDLQEYITDNVLAQSGYTFFLIMPHIEKVSLKNVSKANALADYCLMNDNFTFIGLCNSDDNQIATFAANTGAMYPIYITDEKPLQSIVRSNPGLTLLHNGTVIAKWSRLDIPSVEAFEKNYLSKTPEQLVVDHQIKERLTTQILLLTFLIVIITFSYILRKLKKNNKHADTPAVFVEET